MERLDYYDIMPKGMDAYLASHGHHFSKPMLEWAVSMMRDRSGNKVAMIDRKALDDKLKANGVQLERTEGYYDPLYVFLMAKSDYLDQRRAAARPVRCRLYRRHGREPDESLR